MTDNERTDDTSTRPPPFAPGAKETQTARPTSGRRRLAEQEIADAAASEEATGRDGRPAHLNTSRRRPARPPRAATAAPPRPADPEARPVAPADGGGGSVPSAGAEMAPPVGSGLLASAPDGPVSDRPARPVARPEARPSSPADAVPSSVGTSSNGGDSPVAAPPDRADEAPLSGHWSSPPGAAAAGRGAASLAAWDLDVPGPGLIPDPPVVASDSSSAEEGSSGPGVPAFKARVSAATAGGRRWLRRVLDVAPAAAAAGAAIDDAAAEGGPDTPPVVTDDGTPLSTERDGVGVEATASTAELHSGPGTPDAAGEWSVVGAPEAPPLGTPPGLVAPAPALRRGARRPDLSGLQEMRVDRSDGETPDWMARRIVESEAPGAAYELGKQRRWRRRKVTVLRSRTDRRLIRRIDTWTVFKVSLMFYLLMVVIVLVAGTATWSVAEHLGFINDIQKSVRSLADDRTFVFHGNVALRYAAYGGIALGLLGTLFNTVAAMLYNLLSDVFGGLQIIVVTEPD